jgi:hypothetical protein
MFRAYHGIQTCVVPADLELYRSLLPEVFSMPARPVVLLFVVSYTKVVPWPMTPYLETSVVLASSYAEQEGWHVLTMPVTEKVPMEGGRAMGFPKYIADQIRLEETEGGWHGEERHEGASRLRLAFTPGLTRELEGWEQDMWDDPAFFRGECHLLLPPGEGPGKVRVTFDHRVPPHWSPVMGMVRVTVNAEMPWAGLVPPGLSAPGTFNRFAGGTNLVAEGMD